MIRAQLLSAVAAGFLYSGGAAYGVDLTFAGHDFQPFTSKSDTKIGGYFGEVILAACERANITCDTFYYPNRRTKELVKQKKIDCGVPYGWNEDRDKEYFFSHPMVDTAYGIFVSKSSGFNPTKLEDVAGRSIGVAGPSNTQNSLEKVSKKLVGLGLKPIDIKIVPNFDGANLKKLSLNRIDGVYVNRDLGNTVLKRKKIFNVKYAFTHRKLRYYATIKQNHTNAKVAAHKRFSDAVAAMAKDGSLTEILAKWDLPPMDLKGSFK